MGFNSGFKGLRVNEYKFEVRNKSVFVFLLPRVSDILSGVLHGCAI